MRLVTVAILFVANQVAYSAAPCAATPAAAVRAFEGGLPGAASSGFRVVRVNADALLGVNWAEVKRCDHPEWPGLSLATRGVRTRSATVARAVAAVRAGETVRIWRREANVRLEMVAVSDEDGGVGDRIRLHVATANGEPVRYCFGLVRGPSNVEME